MRKQSGSQDIIWAAMGSSLVQVRHLSTPTGALQCAANFCPTAAFFWPCSRSMMMDWLSGEEGER